MRLAVMSGLNNLDDVRKGYNEFAKGGDIYIKPANRGKFTALKERTGHSATWFKEHGTPAQKKMAVFELNARKWKHNDGGPIVAQAMSHYYDGKSEPTQQMNLFRNTNKAGDVWYTYRENPDSEEIRLTPVNTLLPDPSQWTFTDSEGRTYTPRKHSTPTQAEFSEAIEEGPIVGAAKNYLRELQYRVNNDPASILLKGKYTMPAIAASALLPVVGEAFAGTSIAGIPATTWANSALSAASAGHGLHHAFFEGIDGVGDAALTALELTPLGGMVFPKVKITRNTVNKSKRSITRKPSVKSEGAFKSELDWSPEGWFGTRTTKGYDAEDVVALQAHLPEYIEIEKTTKANGTWLKMSDGSFWQGDPRSWVQLQSKEGQKLLPKRIFHADNDVFIDKFGRDYTPTTLGTRKIWGSDNPYIPHTYGKRQYEIAVPQNVRTVEFNANGANWNAIKDTEGSIVNTNDISRRLSEEGNVVIIKNVIDQGKLFPNYKALPKGYHNETIQDYHKRIFLGDDFIIGPKTPRKSLLGNNGNFDLSNPNIYKSFFPIGVGITSYNNLLE